MINTFAQIDYLASAGRSPWHRASAISKLGLTLLFVLLAVFTPSWGTLLALLITAAALCLGAQLPAKLILAAATLYHEDYVPTAWQTVLVYWAALLGSLMINIFFNK